MRNIFWVLVILISLAISFVLLIPFMKIHMGMSLSFTDPFVTGWVYVISHTVMFCAREIDSSCGGEIVSAEIIILYMHQTELFLKKKGFYFVGCPPGRNRTCDPLLKRELLYQLSYGRIYVINLFAKKQREVIRIIRYHFF